MLKHCIYDVDGFIFKLLLCNIFYYNIHRLSRDVEIGNTDMAAKMKNELLLIMHDALDNLGKYPTTRQSRETVRGVIETKLQQKYPNMWSEIVEYGCNMSSSIRSDKLFAVNIDGVYFILFSQYTPKISK